MTRRNQRFSLLKQPISSTLNAFFRNHSRLWFIILFYLESFNLIITIKLVMNWGIPHSIIFGWPGISLTPIGDSPERMSNSLLVLACLIFLLHVYLILLYHYICTTRLEKGSILFRFFNSILTHLIFTLTLYLSWHVALSLATLWNNFPCLMDFNLGKQCVSIVPIFEDKVDTQDVVSGEVDSRCERNSVES